MFKKSLALIMLFTPPAILATENPHRLGLSYGIGSIESDLNNVDPTLSLTDIVYGYQMSPEWILEVGYLSADTESFDILLEDLFFDTDIDIQTVHVGFKGIKSLNEHNDLYLRVQLNRYDVDIELQDSGSSNDTGTSFGFAAGWQYNFENNIGLNLDYAWNDFGDLDTKTLSLGVTFSF